MTSMVLQGRAEGCEGGYVALRGQGHQQDSGRVCCTCCCSQQQCVQQKPVWHTI